jgi:hypothetical protein
MGIIKITTEDESLVKSYMTNIMSFDEGLIEIIVGWDLAKSLGGSILNHKISENRYWTFSPREKRKIFEEHLQSFLKESVEEIINKTKINNLNPIDFENEKEYLKFIKQSVGGCDGYLYSNRLYVYCGNLIYHIDLGLLQFMSWDIIDEVKKLITIKEYEKPPKELGDIDIKYIPYLNAKKGNTISDVC